MINIGNYNNNLFISNIIINSTIPNNINLIRELIKSKGYNYIQYLYTINNKFEIKNNIYILTILDLINNNEKQKNIPNIKISEKLKSLLVICIHHYINIQITNNNMKENKYNKQQLDDVCLININWLNKLGFDKLIRMFKEDNRIKSILESNYSYEKELQINLLLESKFNFKDKTKKINSLLNNDSPDNYNENEILLKIINYLDKKVLDEIENDLNIINFQEINQLFYPEKEIIGKNINIYNNFIIVNKKLFHLLVNNFNISKYTKFLKYISRNKKNIIIIDNLEQKTILLGSIINNENYFKLYFIFNY